MNSRGDIYFEMRPAALVSSAGEHYENQPTSVLRMCPAPAFRSGARCRRVQVLTGRKSNETKTWNAARNVGHVYWAGGGARCRELTASRQPAIGGSAVNSVVLSRLSRAHWMRHARTP